CKTLTPDEAKLLTHHAKPAELNDYYIFFSRKNPNAKALADKFDSDRKTQGVGGAAKIFAK
ncbi:MAG: hypothetical protein IPH37_11945, partial [Burkholderiales bacterium]|nr:hypothetical protein [Burkholderiales bacterium]